MTMPRSNVRTALKVLKGMLVALRAALTLTPYVRRNALRVGVVTLLALYAVFSYVYPAVLAGVGSLVVGPREAFAGLRGLTITVALVTLLNRWHILLPWQRWVLIILGLGLPMNLARNQFTGNPLTLSYLVLLLAPLLLALRWGLPGRTDRLLKENAALKRCAQCPED